ncbi:MAG TPA: PEGA domain-containing protein, partial [Polyangia bacterium]|nr:PEGA domain-containing protein [Polyangia bacterium]
ERRRPRRRRWVGMLTMLTFLVGGMTWLMALERTPRAGVERAPRIAVAPPATSAATPAMIAAAPATIVSPPSPARSPTVVVRVFTLPSGARVLVDAESQARGRTPLSLTLERSDVSRTIRLVAAGYRPASVEVTPSVDGQLHFALERERPRARRRPSAIVPLH